MIARLNTGGPAMHVVHLAKDLESYGFDTRLVAGAITADEGDMTYYAAERGIDVTEVAGMTRLLSAGGDLRALWQLVRLFRRERPWIVHTHTAKAGTLGRLAAILTGVPVRIHTYHGHVLGGSYFSSLKTELFRFVERQLGRATQRLVVLTDDQKLEMSEDLRIAEARRFVRIPLGLELERFADVDGAACRAEVRAEAGIPEDAWVVGIVGRLVPVKNHELFFRAFRILADGTERDVRAVIVGAGEREEELTALARTLGIAERVHWLGWRSDLPEVLPALDTVALTSHDEGTPVALLEALAAGVPVVSRAVGGVAEVLERGKRGILVDSDHPDAFARALLERVATPVPESETERNREWVLHGFSRSRLAADMADLYRAELVRAGLIGPPETVA